MKTEKMLWYYFYGNYNYYLLLRNHIYDENHQIDINTYSINAAKVGMISNLMLAIKEQIVEKKANLNYESKIFSEELEKCVNIISKKNNGKYFVDGCCFDNPSILTSTLRNKLAHGDFLMDLSNSIVIFNIQNKKVRVNIDDLSCFAISGVNNAFDRSNENKFKRTLILSQNYEFKRTKSITTLEEVKEFVKTLYKFEIEIIPKPGSKITKELRDKFEFLLKLFVRDNDSSYIFNFRKEYENQFFVNYKIKNIKKDDVEKLSNFLFKITPTDEDYNSQINSYLNEATRVLDKSFEKDNVMLSIVKNFIYLDTIQQQKTYDKEEVLKAIVNKYNNYYLNYDQLASSIISMFSSLFVYPMEDVYDNPNIFISDEIKGLDYSILDMRLFDIEKYTIENPKMNELIVQRDATSKKLDKTNEEFIKNETNLNNVKGNTKVQNILLNKRIVIQEKSDILTNKLNGINRQIIINDNYVASNYEYLKNKSIIEGIRNSISHGNYKIEIGTCMEDSMIVFEDIYNGELTFKAKVTINDFSAFCFLNADIIFNKERKNIYAK